MITFAVLALAVSVVIAAPWSPSRSGRAGAPSVPFTPHPSVFALHTIPTGYLHEYWKAAEEYGLDWTKLAAVGQIESDQGRSHTPGVNGGTNTAGAAGPAQFVKPTWARYGVDADGRGTINPYDPADAITAMAAYLKASGAPQNWRAALYTYNHSTAYVNDVISLSRLYLGPHPTRG
jgi:membrane-bound lytic murein transglycosylase B